MFVLKDVLLIERKLKRFNIYIYWPVGEIQNRIWSIWCNRYFKACWVQFFTGIYIYTEIIFKWRSICYTVVSGLTVTRKDHEHLLAASVSYCWFQSPFSRFFLLNLMASETHFRSAKLKWLVWIWFYFLLMFEKNNSISLVEDWVWSYAFELLLLRLRVWFHPFFIVVNFRSSTWSGKREEEGFLHFDQT